MRTSTAAAGGGGGGKGENDFSTTLLVAVLLAQQYLPSDGCCWSRRVRPDFEGDFLFFKKSWKTSSVGRGRASE
jgi:hypothetical protein